MRTTKQELISDELKPFACQIIKEARQKYNYSFEDLSNALGHAKNRQTLHKYETGSLNIPYDIFFEICRIFNVESSVLEEIPISKKEKEFFEKKIIKDYVKNMSSYIITGDFNTTYTALSLITGTKVNTGSFVTNEEDGAIDNIIVKGYTVGKGTMVETNYSDHEMLYADVTF